MTSFRYTHTEEDSRMHNKEAFRAPAPAAAIAHINSEREAIANEVRRYASFYPQSATPAQEPAAWLFELARAVHYDQGRKYYDAWEPQLSLTKPNVPEGSVRNLRPLYVAAPRAQTAEGEALHDALQLNLKINEILHDFNFGTDSWQTRDRRIREAILSTLPQTAPDPDEIRVSKRHFELIADELRSAHRRPVVDIAAEISAILGRASS